MDNLIDKKYAASEIEQGIYENWENMGYFKPSDNLDTPYYSVILPPPNVTGILHIRRDRPFGCGQEHVCKVP